MLRKCFSLASAVTLGGLVVWAGCSSDDPAKGGSGADGGGSGGDGSQSTSGGNDDSSTTTGKDSGGSSGDTGTLPPLKGVDITYGTCPAFEKCGGDIKGDFKVTGGCLSNSVFNQAREQPNCEAVKESDIVIKAEGTVKVTDTTIERKTEVNFRGKVEVPKACVPLGCRAVEVALRGGLAGFKFDEATCADNGTVCNCNAAAKIVESSTDTYVDDGDGTITTTQTTPQGDQTHTFDYCAKGNKTSYKETTGGEKALDLVIEIAK